jgi:hypothetical protein
MNELYVLSAIVLLPLIPAFLLFKLLPSRAVVKGPLAGLDVSLGGAFGGYVALTVFVATFFTQGIAKPTALQIRGTMLFPDGEPHGIVTCDVHPPNFQRAGAEFVLDLDAGKAPFLQCSADGYDPQPVFLDKAGKPSNGTLELKQPIVFKKSPPYQPNQTVQVAGGIR